MKHVLIPALLVGIAFVQDDEPQKKIAKLVEQLGAEDFDVREKATAELKKIGKPAEAALRKALEHEDPEVRSRAKSILGELEKKDEKKPVRPGGRGASVVVQSTNGNSVYKITPVDADPITFTKNRDGGVKLECPEKTVESESMEKFLKDHKDLATAYGITAGGIDYGGARVSFGGPAFRMPRFQVWPQDEDDEDWSAPPDRFGWTTPSSAHGATLEKVTDLLRAHLEIPEGAGLVVSRVKEDSLAAQVGLKKHDILLEVDGTKIARAKDLKDALKLESKVTVLRQGKKLELKKEK